MCMIKDIPEETFNSLASSKVAAICQDTSIIPLKVTLRLLDLLVKEGYTPEKPQTTKEATATNDMEVEVQVETSRADNDSNQNAVRADDAEIPEYLWNQILAPSGRQVEVNALGQLRRLALCWWKSNARKSFFKWFFNTYPRLKQKLGMCGDSYAKWNDCLRVYLRTVVEARKDWVAGQDCLEWCCNSTWWEWNDGSRPHFWRWDEEYKTRI